MNNIKTGSKKWEQSAVMGYDPNLKAVINNSFGQLTSTTDIILELTRDNIISKDSIREIMHNCIFILRNLGFDTSGLSVDIQKINIYIRKDIGHKSLGCYRTLGYKQIFDNIIIDLPPQKESFLFRKDILTIKEYKLVDLTEEEKREDVDINNPNDLDCYLYEKTSSQTSEAIDTIIHEFVHFYIAHKMVKLDSLIREAIIREWNLHNPLFNYLHGLLKASFNCCQFSSIKRVYEMK